VRLVDTAVHEERSSGGLPNVPVRLDGTELVMAVGAGHVGANIALEQSSPKSLVESRIVIEEEGVNLTWKRTRMISANSSKASMEAPTACRVR
jgi:hypothetical protein